MTREEMWEEFESQLKREVKTPMTMSYDDSIRIAEMGIKDVVKKWKKRLEQEPCEDAVSRKVVDQNIYDYAESNGLSYANLKNAILDVPSVTPTQRWIPISERLPKVEQRVIFGMNNGTIYIGALHMLGNDLKITLEPTGIGCVYSFENVIAWMPLPQPYKAESEE